MRRLARDQSAATAVEYAIIVAGIAGLIIATVLVFGRRVSQLWEAPLSLWR